MCDICAKNFVTNDQFRNHKDKEHRKEQNSRESCSMCDICAKDFVTTVQLRNHKDDAHRMKNNEINSTNEFKSIKCDSCAIFFTSQTCGK